LRYGGWSGLHEAAKHGRLDAVLVLLAHGADPNAREAGDNTHPLHWAAAHGHLEIVRALLDAGGDVHGHGADHAFDVRASFFRAPGDEPQMDAPRRELVALLVKSGAQHHLLSAICTGDLELIRQVVEDDPEWLDRRFEGGQTPLHFAISRRRYDILDLLIELGADLEAEDRHGRTALAASMLQGDREAIRRLQAAGAKQPPTVDTSNLAAKMAALAGSVRKCVPMIYVPDVVGALEWYASIGFKELARYEDDGLVNFGMLSFGGAELMLNMHGKPGRHDVSLWFYTENIDAIYELLKSRQIQAARTGEPGIEFEQDIEDMFYGVRQFGIRDLNGYVLYFEQDLPRA
jgi:hypothetical protein